MDGHAHGVDRLTGGIAPAFSHASWNRYALMPRPLARLVLALLAAFVILAAWAPGMSDGPKDVPTVKPMAHDVAVPGKPAVVLADDDGKDNDLRLYRLIIGRIQRGDNYYQAATELQRANNYPVAPGLTVRLPTLAFAEAALGPRGTGAASILLLAAVLLAVHRRFGQEPGGDGFRLFGIALLFVGLASAVRPQYAVLHELWAGELMVLSLALHQPAKGRWLGAVLAAAAALAIRETALPFALLMLAWALWHRRWREGVAWGGLIALFAVALAIHVHLAEAQIRPGDPVSPPWLVFGGLQGFLYKVIHSSSLNMLPNWLAGPVAILAIFGWTGWNSPLGNFASLLTLGYGLAFMIAGRDNNFYWGVMIVPVLLMGLAMMPFAARSLWQNALGKPEQGRAHG